MIAGVLLGSVILVSLVAVMFSKKASTPIDMTRLVRNERIATGSAKPKVTIVEFSDLQCPACKASAPYVKQIVQTLPDVRLVYRHFPLTGIHKNALAAAQAAEAMQIKGKFWEFHDILFEKQSDWEKLSDSEAKKKFGEYAQTLGVMPEDLQKATEDQATQKNVNEDISDGNVLGISGTPTFYVNGKKVDVKELQQAVESALKVE